ncbi:MAG: hypothetical protein IPK03_14415 [Bacteroidetes bacterium]|nr:hypothetical protein [Bacteroidota bacterium]
MGRYGLGGIIPFGQIGIGTKTDRTSPIQVGTAVNWVSIAAGNGHSLGIKSDGTLWAWGRNTDGQLGNGITIDSASPVQIGVANNWVSVSAGASHTFAIKSNGTLWAWGRNDFGQLGDGTTANKLKSRSNWQLNKLDNC